LLIGACFHAVGTSRFLDYDQMVMGACVGVVLQIIPKAVGRQWAAPTRWSVCWDT
jgi:hypothetical protein